MCRSFLVGLASPPSLSLLLLPNSKLISPVPEYGCLWLADLFCFLSFDPYFYLGLFLPKSALSIWLFRVFDMVYCPNFFIATFGVLLKFLRVRSSGGASVKYCLLIFLLIICYSEFVTSFSKALLWAVLVLTPCIDCLLDCKLLKVSFLAEKTPVLASNECFVNISGSSYMLLNGLSLFFWYEFGVTLTEVPMLGN